MSGMKKQIVKLLFICMLPCIAAPMADAYVNRDVAVVAIMNKAAGKVQHVRIPVGKTAGFEKLTMTVRACKQTDPFQAEDEFMFIEVSKNGEGQIFSNWMSKNEPGDNPMQNADYDLWLVGCETTGK